MTGGPTSRPSASTRGTATERGGILCKLRLSIQQIGIIGALVSLTFFFGALLFAFGLRMNSQPVWQHFYIPPLLWGSTAVIAASSATLEAARFSVRRALVSVYRNRLLAAVLLGLAFLGMQTVAGAELLGQGVAIAGNPHGSAFYVFIAIHGVHLLAGIIWLAVLWHASKRLLQATEQELRRHRRTLSTASLFWHFMGILWVVLFIFLRHWVGNTA
jgi:cytochrome c oxidase subunit 3